MSAVVNDRDVILQAAGVRLLPVTLPDNIIIPALKAVELKAPSLTFQVATSGVASPAAIALTATLRQIAGAITFSVVAGAATLTGAGATRSLAYADMASDSVTIRASVTEAGITYSSDLTIAKVRDGTSGTDGVRGTRQLYLSSPAYTNGYGAAAYAAAATAAIAAATAGSAPSGQMMMSGLRAAGCVVSAA